MAEKLKIIFEDSRILVIDKPAGLVVNRSATVDETTLQDQLSEYFKLGNNLGIGDRAGIVHRLDRETSGILIVAKTQRAFDVLQAQFKERSVKKEYTALVHGRVGEDSGSIVGDIGRVGKFGRFGIVDEGRASRTDFKVVRHYKFRESRFNVLISAGRTSINSVHSSDIHQNKPTKSRVNYLKNHAKNYTLVHLFPRTGRTHQVRVHLKTINHAVVSDSIYAPSKLIKFDKIWCPRLFLHASRIEFKMPGKNKVRFVKNVVFKVPLPYDLVKACDYLEILPNG